MRRAFERLARAFGVVLETMATPAELRARVDRTSEPFDAVLCEFHLRALDPGATSAEIVRELHAMGIVVAVITTDVETAALTLGALVPVYSKMDSFASILERSAEAARLLARALDAEPHGDASEKDTPGSSPASGGSRRLRR